MTFLFWHINFFTSWTKDFNSGSSNLFTHTDRQYMLPFTEYSWTNTKYSFQEFFFHHCKSFRGKYESGVNQAINIGSLLIDSEISLIFKLLIFWWFRSENHLKRLIVMIKHLFNTIKIEIITNVLFINFTEKLMIFQVTKPINPSNTLLRTV